MQTDLPREGKQLSDDRFDAAAYSRKVFGMFSGEEKTLKLEMPEPLYRCHARPLRQQSVRFPADNEHFYLDVIVCPQFFPGVSV